MGEEGSETRRKAEGVISAVIEPVLCDNGFEIINPLKLSNPGPITNSIVNHIMDDDLVIANLTGTNANVMYELAIRNAVLKPIIYISENKTVPPFDIVGDRVLYYDDDLAGASSIINTLDEAVKNTDTNAKQDNPIHRAINNRFAQIQNDQIKQMANRIGGEDGDTLKLILEKLMLLEQANVQVDRSYFEKPTSYKVPIDIEIGSIKTVNYLTISNRLSVQRILDHIYYLIADVVLPYEYMKTWILKEESTHMYLIMNEIRDIIPSTFVFRQDFRWKVVKWEQGIIQQHW